VLILYSHGLVERRRESISVGLARLEASARTLSDEPIDELCERLMAELTTTSTNDDDAVLLCLRFSPVTAQRFQRRIPAHARELAPTRAAIRSWLKGHADPASVGHRLLLTVGEALTNAIEHAYHGRRPGVIDLSISDGGDGALHVEVRDHGRWREAVDRPGRGYADRVIRGLSTGVQRRSGSAGTTLTFSLPISETSERRTIRWAGLRPRPSPTGSGSACSERLTCQTPRRCRSRSAG
jgi:anti-sigma regulatory factor (Ser/Thr protein kinase)